MAARAEILTLLAEHAGQPVDYVALFMFLNTVAGGHYQERYSETELTAAVRELLATGEIEAWQGEQRLTVTAETFAPGRTPCHFRLPQ